MLYFLCCMFVLYEFFLPVLCSRYMRVFKNNLKLIMCCIAVLYFFRVWNFVLYFLHVEFRVIFSTCGISCYIFPRVEFCVVFFYHGTQCYIFCVCNILVLRMEFSCCIFPCVKISFYTFLACGIFMLYFS